MKKIIIMASGRGSNAEALFAKSQQYQYEISAIVSDNAEALVLKKAKEWNIPTIVIPRNNLTRAEHESAILNSLRKVEFDLIVLAGYMRLLTPAFISAFPPRSIVNIHPSLLPAYPGLDSYRRAYEAGEKTSGITIHYVDQGMDTGSIITQHSFSKVEGESLESFEARGLALEHQSYPQTVGELLKTSHSYRAEIYPADLSLASNSAGLSARMFLFKTDGPCAQLRWICESILIDEVVESLHFSNEHLAEHFNRLKLKSAQAVEVTFLAGVTDNTAFSARDALLKHPALKNREMSLYSGKMHFTHERSEDISASLYKRWANSWLEKARVYQSDELAQELRFLNIALPEVKLTAMSSQNFDLNRPDEELITLSSQQLWALSLEELHFIRKHFATLGRAPSEVEMEIIAQTWSEHCKHKIFAAEIEHEDHEGKRKISSLFKTFIRGATSRIIEERQLDWCRSVFTDNAGIVRWDDQLDLCIKVETHNSPSALDPYGGALTGILGVNRDILGCGFGAKPIANTDVFCLPPLEAYEDQQWPSELHPPARLRSGVHKGVQDGGNKSGIPTVNGAFYYDLSYAGKPLVYCGTIGVLPHKIKGVESHEKNQRPGDFVVMVGGRIGKDGIHGATFSSEELKEGTPSTVVQIGDPLTQKRVTDFILKARDFSLYSSITDNGAGGLSSSIGEMAALTNGAKIDLALAPVKYDGLTAAELMISESQERMTCAVPPKDWQAFKALAESYGVEATCLGTFTSDGYLTVHYGSEVVAQLALSFLHDDLPAMKLKSHFREDFPREVWKDLPRKNIPQSFKEKTMALLSHPNIRSHEKLVRQYDHEVKAASVTKPFSMNGGPSDGAVIAMKPHGGGENNGVVIASGLAPHVSLQDTKLMAKFAIDEAVRNAVVTGANPEKMVLVDNFCWPDPLPGPRNPDFAQKLGELVRCNEGLYEMATTLGMPFVSGKDSMKNDAVVSWRGNKTKISVLPTLLITCMGHIEDVNKTIHSLFRSGEDLWTLGVNDSLNPHTLNTVTGKNGKWGDISAKLLKERYIDFHQAIQKNLISGAHDVSDGGVVIALIEMALNSRVGFEVKLNEKALFGEGMGMIVFSAATHLRDKIKNHFSNAHHIGSVRTDEELIINSDRLSLAECRQAFQGEQL
jgi:phosphoribosylformylglycinamidine synthase subunit PurSL